VLIVGCGCRGRALAGALIADGHAVRGTTRDAGRAEAIRAAGAEPYVGDPDRPGTMMAAWAGVAVMCWLLGSARGDPEAVAALQGPRLRTTLEELVDTPVRGVVYEAAGTAPPPALAEGREVARAAHETWRIPLAVVDADPADHERWLADARAAVEGLLAR